MTVRPKIRQPRLGVRIAAATLGLLVLVAVAAPWISPYDPAESINLPVGRLQAPSAAHWLGTDAIARDVLSRVIHGTRVSLETAGLALAVVLLIGVPWGGLAGMASPRVDRWMMRFVDAVLAMPRLLVVLSLVTFTGRMSAGALALLLGLTGWPAMSRIVRARVRDIEVADYVTAARAMGVPWPRIFLRHVLPGTSSAILAGSVLTLAAVIPLEAALSYFGVGIAPPTPSWGLLLQDARAQPLDAWWLLLFPSLAIAATILSVNVLGERLQRGFELRAR